MPFLRIDKIISDSGLATRSEAALLIKRGVVTVNGRPVASGAEKFDTDAAVIEVNGKALQYEKYITLMMNKPEGFISATQDRNERTVIELLDDNSRRKGLFPAGRLDKDAEGLLLLTNDGALAHRITSPVKKVAKRYYVKTRDIIKPSYIEEFEKGLVLRDGTVCAPALLEPQPEYGAIVTIYEGKYHQVKRMLAAAGTRVLYLKRVSIGGLELDENLRPGEYRVLTKDEISSVFDNR